MNWTVWGLISATASNFSLLWKCPDQAWEHTILSICIRDSFHRGKNPTALC